MSQLEGLEEKPSERKHTAPEVEQWQRPEKSVKPSKIMHPLESREIL